MEIVDWTNGVPRSPRFGDVYHSTSGALAQARHVFLGGCGLPAAWQGQPQWRILETGFGLGLNFLAAWQAWRDDPHRCGQLIFESVEAWPVAPDDIRRAARAEGAAGGPVTQEGGLAGEPADVLSAELTAELADGLAAAPNWSRGQGRVTLPLAGGRVMLVVEVGDIVTLANSRSWQGHQDGGVLANDRQDGNAEPAATAAGADVDTAPRVDSIFLDGFSPARNPAIWSPAVLAALGGRARAGAGLATWTVAAAVRRGLDEAGFDLVRRPGLPPKRHCLAGRRRPGD